jgi:hypothetical protein
MSYDRFGRTPEQARRERIMGWVTIGVLGVMVAGICTCAALVVMMLS